MEEEADSLHRTSCKPLVSRLAIKRNSVINLQQTLLSNRRNSKSLKKEMLCRAPVAIKATSCKYKVKLNSNKQEILLRSHQTSVEGQEGFLPWSPRLSWVNHQSWYLIRPIKKLNKVGKKTCYLHLQANSQDKVVATAGSRMLKMPHETLLILSFKDTAPIMMQKDLQDPEFRIKLQLVAHRTRRRTALPQAAVIHSLSHSL